MDLAAGGLPEGMDVAGLEDAAGDLGIDTSGLDALGMSDDASGASQDIASSGEPAPEPGLYGNQYELLVDTSRLPRVDQFQRMITADSQLALEDIPSDVKTVAYYVVTEANAGLVTSAQLNNSEEPEYGLARRVLDRAVTLRATESAGSMGLQNAGVIIAPEVVGIEFQYFDGAEWLMEWDSSEKGGLPVAVRILLAIRNEQGSVEQTDVTSMTDVQTPHKIYSLTVRIPIAQPTAESDTTTMEDMEAVGL